MDASLIQRRADQVRERIRVACDRVGRDPEEVTVIAVTKTFPETLLLAACEAGLCDLGENKAQEFARKFDAINPMIERGVTWHFIGHLQRNKVKLVAGRAHLIHGVDSIRLARALQDFAETQNIVLRCLVQMNVSGEFSKFGIDPAGLADFLEQARRLDRISIEGLMTLASATSDDARLHKEFKLLRTSLDSGKKVINTMTCLSMGMSGDFEIAIEEGATHVRLGSVLFGSRDL